MILSDRSIREAIDAGRIVIEPLGEGCIQPSSVDLHIDRFFRVFKNHTMGHIDVKEDLQELTELVEVGEDDVFILHPGEFVLGASAERIGVPDDLVGRLEGKSSLGRLGLLIHSSLPGSEPVLFLHDGELRERPIEDIVRKQLEGSVVGFDPETFEVGYFPVTGWYEGPPDRIFEVRLRSGRSVRVTAGHNLFTLDRGGELTKVRTGALQRGVRVALPRRVPDPTLEQPVIDLRGLLHEGRDDWLVVEGPTVAARVASDPSVPGALRSLGVKHTDFYARIGALPMRAARLLPDLVTSLGAEDRLRSRGGRNGVPVVVEVDASLAWLIGLYIAEGYRRQGQVTVSNTDESILDRAQSCFAALGLPVHRSEGAALTCSSRVLSELIGWLGIGDGSHNKRIPPVAFGWPQHLLEALFEGMVDGDGSRDEVRDSYWTSSPGLVADVLLLAPRLGRRAAAWCRKRQTHGLYQVGPPIKEHKLLCSVPLPDELLRAVRAGLGISQRAASARAGYRHPTDLNNIERRRGRDAVRVETLRRLRDAYAVGNGRSTTPTLDRLVDGDLLWDEVLEVRDTGKAEPVFDLEVRPDGRKIENFLAGSGGVFVSNTAGFIDAGWDGHITLELSNVANLPITLYPGMKIGQISFLQMTTPADQPYGTGTLGSKYKGQRGPTPSRYFENFRPRR